jgi:hypothetical protein
VEELPLHDRDHGSPRTSRETTNSYRSNATECCPRSSPAGILALIERHRGGVHRSLGIICKTVTQVKPPYHVLSETGVELIVLAYKSTAFVGGIVIPP